MEAELFLAIAVYLLVGIIALGLLDFLTGRIRSRLENASHETQAGLISTGSFISPRVAFCITVIALWVFWPAAVYGAIERRLKDRRSKP